MKYTTIESQGQKWLRPINVPYPNEDDQEEGIFQLADAVLYKQMTADLLYIGSKPAGSTVDESEVREVRQYRKIGAGLDWTTCPSEQVEKAATDRPSFELRDAYTDAESHDLYVFDEILNNTSDDAKMNVSLQMDLNYWKRRCEAAENYINESPCDPDITNTQNAAYEAWQEIVKEESK